MGDKSVILLFHIRGRLVVEGPKVSYDGGVMATSRVLDSDKFHYYDILQVLEGLECSKQSRLLYKLPQATPTNHIVSELQHEINVREMFSMYGVGAEINIYVDDPFDFDEDEEDEGGVDQIDEDEKDDGEGGVDQIDEDENDEGEGGEEQMDEDGVDSDETDPEYTYSGSEGDNTSGVNDSSDDDMDSDDGLDDEGTNAPRTEEDEGTSAHRIQEDVNVHVWTELEADDSSDDQRSLGDSDEGDRKLNEPEEFVEERDMKKPRLVCGMVFPNVTKFRALLKEYHIREGFQFKYLKNEGTRVTVQCIHNPECNFRLHASRTHDTGSFQIKRIKGSHSCTRTYNNKWATSTWLAKKYAERLHDTPEWRLKSMKTDVRKKWKLNVTDIKMYRAKKKAEEMIQGNHKDQYLRLRDYCGMILKTNPGSTAILKVERPWLEHSPIFERVFITYVAQVEGFIVGCRPIIGLDACFLKGPYGGQLIHATARDGNNQMYPLAMAVVEAENNDSWAWFLEKLIAAIGSPEEKGWAFISDRQKGLINSFDRLLPNVEHRYCMRHLYANFQKMYKGKEYKDLMWGAASAYAKPDFDEKMIELRSLNEEAHKWLVDQKPEHWARHLYGTRSKCNRMVNNCSEGFNSLIKDAREQPILTMLETIRRQLMKRYQEKIELANKFQGILCPKIKKKLDKSIDYGMNFEALYSGGSIFEVIGVGVSHVVDLGAHTCTCREWDVKGIPCSHACAAIGVDKSKPEDYVDPYYHCDTFIKTYNHRILPILDQRMWTESCGDLTMPPPLRRGIGRPKKARRRGEEEPQSTEQVRKHYQQLRCRNCGELGHNRRTCKGAPVRGRARNSVGRGRGRTSVGTNEGDREVGISGAIRGRGRGAARGTPAGPRGRGRSKGIVDGGRGRGRGTSRGTTAAMGRGGIKGRGASRGATIGRGANQGWPAWFNCSQGSNAQTSTVTTVQWFGGTTTAPIGATGPNGTQGSST